MARVIILKKLEDKIQKIFKKESIKILKLLLSLEDNPKKGKELAHIGKLVVKELKYKKFRFYFVTDGFKVKFHSVDSLTDLLIKFVRMSDKKDQQKVINEVKKIMKQLGQEGF
ncbi:hypothetical protein HOA92_03435 [archaeon]|jgi:hypothetical protein|nr:hypothetical protein [archaeon]MBT6762064.1 hypothetical protein [archaeon]